ncbi:MAG: YncE family protein [Gemmatimonadales bacterium]|jgi:DNA-binding beta-propeller fold protein YncE
MRLAMRLFALAFLALAAGALPARAQSYHVTATYKLGGDGGWDYMTLDTVGHRLFIARQDRIMVVDEATDSLLGEIPGFNRAHGVAFAYRAGHGFATSGGDSAVRMFDLKTLAVLGKTVAANDDDGILFDPATGHIVTMNGDAGSASVLDARTGKLLGNVDLGGKPEFGVSAADGKLYINLEDKSEVVEVDARAMRVLRHWSIAPCESPSGLAIDRAHHRLFSGCRNGLMGVSDAVHGRLVTTVPIGRGVDACRYDPATRLAFASNGDGTLTVIHEDAPDKYTVVSNATTKQGARTMEIDLANHHVFTVTADFGPAPAPTPERPRPRPTILPGTFALLVLEP